MKKFNLLIVLLFALTLIGCDNKAVDTDNFKYQTEKFADLRILRYKVPGFNELSLKEKKLVYYLYQAALSGRDIIYDHNYKYNLTIRRTLEAIVNSYSGESSGKDWDNFLVYTKRVWFSNGIHHHYSNKKILPDITKKYFTSLVKYSDSKLLPLSNGESVDNFLKRITPIIFDPKVAPEMVTFDSNVDVIKNSAVNFYEGVTQKEVENYYKKVIDKKDPHPISYGLNSKMIKVNGKIVEMKWMLGGMYSSAIEKMIYWLKKAAGVAENELQKKTLLKLTEYYKTGDLKVFDEYNKLWVKDTQSRVDAVHGYIEVYSDPLGYRGYYESVISIKDLDATKRIKAIADNVQWFEDNSPIADKYKKQNVVGISAKVITVVVESGGTSPSSPIGINLPNSYWIRKEFGSKSVNLGNIVHAYNKSGSKEFLKEFSYSPEEVELATKYGALTADLKTDMHEVIGHASGQLAPGVSPPKQTLKNYASIIEEARADLVALYYLPNKKLIDIGVSPNADAYKTGYNIYIKNGLMLQLRRIKPGENIEEAHMRNRQMIAKWVYEKGKTENLSDGRTGVIERKTKNGKTYFVINDYQKLRILFGRLLNEMQRISSEGDFAAAKNLVETYGVKVDKDLHKEVLERYKKLNLAPYSGFINPLLKPVMKDGKITDVKIEYPMDFTKQMLFYAKNYSFLPNMN
ncbi:MAG: dihydrofolate reductase [Bacteroidetes bacterium]|nr:dihydrofolate reductase [Bacteroidota bacterium]